MIANDAWPYRARGFGLVIIPSLIIISLITLAVGCNGWGGGTPPKGPQTYVYYLPRQQVWEGLIPYSGPFPQIGVLNAKLTGFQNPNPYPLRLFKPSDAKTYVDLAPSASSRPADINKLYGADTPAVPIIIVAVPQVSNSSVYNSVAVTVNYYLN